MIAALFKDRFAKRFGIGVTLFASGLLIARSYDGFIAALGIVLIGVGTILWTTGLGWIGADTDPIEPDDSIVSRYPIGHALFFLIPAVIGFALLGKGLFLWDSAPGLRERSLVISIGSVMLFSGAAIVAHFASFRIVLRDGQIQSSGGIRPRNRKGPYPLAEISKRKGVDLVDGMSPRTYRLAFMGKRSLDLNAHMTGTKHILERAAEFYDHDYMYDQLPKHW
ncbi:hypothetical protein [Thalassovita aquimarina]|uniref:Uncharacterized protein n=1 Tax=Thalassovita aquimarina TaxID=2785917 RepID=A0ABS5HNJ2_9RHOB|nr:hypothetical protein [Thalassovita aquimarina]MBR9650530.1 hypothetical protein [Thalassovita aquimarina]